MLFEKHEPYVVPLDDFLKKTEEEFETATLPIPLGVGKKGNYVLGNLEKLSHILIAGSTGSGKSNFNHAVIYTLVQKYSSKELQIYLADPKIVEMVIYQDISYLFSNVGMEPEKIFVTLENIVEEKNRRLRENKKAPYLVIIIDTFSDLMMFDSLRFEKIVQDLTVDTLKAGIHLIMCDSRPSVDVFTEKIKKCFPTKIAFNTVNDLDSETILGQMGAEWLLGAGDMFLLEKGKKEPIRLQNPRVSDGKIGNLVEENKKS